MVLTIYGLYALTTYRNSWFWCHVTWYILRLERLSMRNVISYHTPIALVDKNTADE